MRVFGAIDLGASGGRVIAGLVDGGEVTLRTVHRFGNRVELRDGRLRWPYAELIAEMFAGLRELARRYPEVESIGIDTWGVDYGLLDDSGVLLADPVSYRDRRAAGVVDAVHDRVGGVARLYDVNGLQPMPFNTVYQLAADDRRNAARIVLLPDLLGYRLTGVLGTELTMASTTGLLDVRTRDWSSVVLEAIGVRPEMFPPLRQAGEVLGCLRPEVARATGLRPDVVVTTVGSHDTASAVAGIAVEAGPVVFVSSGTWSLVGLELPGPVVTEASRRAGVSNEIGVDGRTLFLRNLAGLWLLQQSLASWQHPDPQALLTAAGELPAGGPIIDVGSNELIPPGAMPERIDALVRATGRRPPDGPAGTVRCILDSLAATYAATTRELARLTGAQPRTIHIVGGGSRNDLLCRLTGQLSGLPVVAGPVEATALGNILVQARAHGAGASLGIESVHTSEAGWG
ncbi:rhamnulokinase [Kribbella aluminosa]|uniref:Rhamnulokinase n=1 Tax=Kribbella aluminosa TaxID=416017 RepID=A0ABS4UJ47_9ACTN|nr:rhamnulokinase family protein [Kribbella aluminosa]MBP2351630.1 rhamnulokinase [Kribbella aluminosa]